MSPATSEHTSTSPMLAGRRPSWLYPPGRLGNRGPENWKEKIHPAFNFGRVVTEWEVPFAVDSGSGYLASIEWRLNAIPPGPHTLDVELQGPGIHGYHRQSRTVSILAEHTP